MLQEDIQDFVLQEQICVHLSRIARNYMTAELILPVGINTA